MSVSGEMRLDFRDCVGAFATGVTVVTSYSNGAPAGMTLNSFTSVSLDPLLVLFCAEKIARFHDAVLAAGSWALSVLDEDSEKVSRWLSTRGRPLTGQLDEIPHHPGPLTGAPILDRALSALECRTTAVHDGGDHSIVVGEVIGVTGPRSPGRPLLYYAGQYRRLDDEPQDVPE